MSNLAELGSMAVNELSSVRNWQRHSEQTIEMKGRRYVRISGGNAQEHDRTTNRHNFASHPERLTLV